MKIYDHIRTGSVIRTYTDVPRDILDTGPIMYYVFVRIDCSSKYDEQKRH